MDMHPNMHRILGCAFIDKKRGFGVETEFYANVKREYTGLPSS